MCLISELADSKGYHQKYIVSIKGCETSSPSTRPPVSVVETRGERLLKQIGFTLSFKVLIYERVGEIQFSSDKSLQSFGASYEKQLLKWIFDL